MPMGSVLVVDDSVVQRKHAVDLCAEFGIPTVHQAAHGAEALDMVSRLTPPPEAILVDLEMPGMDGMALIQKLYEGGVYIPVIIASGRDPKLIQSVAQMVLALGLPLVGSLVKPIQAGPLHELLRQVPHIG